VTAKLLQRYGPKGVRFDIVLLLFNAFSSLLLKNEAFDI
jgi:hypothetical protein